MGPIQPFTFRNAIVVVALLSSTVAFSALPEPTPVHQTHRADRKNAQADIDLAVQRRIEAEKRAESEDAAATRAEEQVQIHKTAAEQARAEASAWAQVELTARSRSGLSGDTSEESQMPLSERDAISGASSEIYMLLIKNWHIPTPTKNGLSATVEIRLFPTGEVDSAALTASSGNVLFDRSVVASVLRAERFPAVAKVQPKYFEQNFRHFQVTFSPEGLRQQ